MHCKYWKHAIPSKWVFLSIITRDNYKNSMTIIVGEHSATTAPNISWIRKAQTQENWCRSIVLSETDATAWPERKDCHLYTLHSILNVSLRCGALGSRFHPKWEKWHSKWWPLFQHPDFFNIITKAANPAGFFGRWGNTFSNKCYKIFSHQRMHFACKFTAEWLSVTPCHIAS